ncbi:TRAP transporter small permease [Anaeroselena agilis]|uniref:TRAP transporter small permease n=1 Tax=Anaeroselena agilis TaxID=3063788 RepID=A0ABU3NZ59_9FIRM|nr:TRAP transporter small permease [Selenomonadales bacterium 4137-cl]
MAKLETLLNAVSEYTDRAALGLVVFIMCAMVVVTTLQVICRVFFAALTWSEELSRYLLVWGTFFAATLAYKRGNHIAITFVIDAFPKRIRALFVTLSYLLSLVFFAAAANYGIEMISLQVFQISPAMGIPMKYIYYSIPISMVIMMIHALAGIAGQVRRVATGEGEA